MEHYIDMRLELIYYINIILINLIIIKLYGKSLKIILINEKVSYNINWKWKQNINTRLVLKLLI